MEMTEIYNAADRLITQLVRQEARAQGHTLTGDMEDSFGSSQVKTGTTYILEGEAISYTQYVNDGVPAKSASFKQAPFLIEYFIKRGFPVYSSKGLDATKLAFMTINKWKKEGMSTQASKRFSSTGARQNFVESAFVGNEEKINDFMLNSFDFSVDEVFNKQKDETL